MPMAAFDTISVAKRLENDFGMPPQQAEGVAVVLHENFVGNVATKEDLKTQSRELSGKIKALDEKIIAQNKKMEGLATTKELEALDEKIIALDKKMEGLATTKELEALDEKIIAQNKKMEGLATKAEVKAEVGLLGKEIFRAMLLSSVAIVGLTVTLIKLLP